MLGVPVVVDRDRACTDVRAFSDGRITDVGKVRDLRASANGRLFDLDETAGLRAVTKTGAGTEMCVRADRCVVTDDDARQDRV